VHARPPLRRRPWCMAPASSAPGITINRMQLLFSFASLTIGALSSSRCQHVMHTCSVVPPISQCRKQCHGPFTLHENRSTRVFASSVNRPQLFDRNTNRMFCNLHIKTCNRLDRPIYITVQHDLMCSLPQNQTTRFDVAYLQCFSALLY